MKRLSTLLFITLHLSLSAQDLTSQIDVFLKKHVKDGLVNYAAIKASPAELNALINQLNRLPLLEGDHEKAMLINAYNLFVIKGIVDHYPVKGPMQIDGFFDKQTFRFRGNAVTLNQLEKQMLYAQFPDPRLHFAVVCAAKGCPKLAAMAYSGHQLDEQLEEQTRKVINDPEFIRLNGSVAQVSKIFEWYADDFGGRDKVIPFIQKYLLKKVKLNPEYSFYEYDWSLNELK